MNNKSLRILLLNWRDPWHPEAGGAEVVTMEHAKGWVERGHSVTWLTSKYPSAKNDEANHGIYLMRRSGWVLIYIWALFFVVFNRKKYDLVIDEIHALPFFSPLVPGIKKVAFIHEVAGEIWDYMAPFPLNIAGKLFERIYFPFYAETLFWTDAESTVTDLMNVGIPKKNITVIPCPISSSIISNTPKKENKPSFIFVSRVVAMKGIEQVIQAFSQIVKEMPSAQLRIIGGGKDEYVKKLKDLIHRLDIETKVKFLGKVSESEKLNYLGKSHVLLHASVKEGWGLVVLEAASQGTPSVVYNVSGLKDVVKDNKTGVVLKKNSYDQLSNEAIALVKDKQRYQKYQKAGLSWVNSLQWKDVIDQSERLLLDAARD